MDATDFKFAGIDIGHGSIAFAYFFSGILLMVAHSLSPVLFGLLDWISLASIPVVVISFYYQAFKIRKWCRFCLMIQGILLLEVAL